MGASLLERVGFVGGNSGGDEPPPLDTAPEVPDLGLDPDPAPAEGTRDKRAARKSAASAKTSASQPRAGGKFVSKASTVKRMSEELDSYAKMLALTWSMTDPECAGVLNETSTRITADLAALLSRSDWVVEKFETTSLLGDCFKLLNGLWPLLKTIYAHHGPAARAAAEGVTDDPTVPVVDPLQYGAWRPNAY